MLKKLKKFFFFQDATVKSTDYGDKIKHELFVNNKRQDFCWQSKIESNYNEKENNLIDTMVKSFMLRNGLEW